MCVYHIDLIWFFSSFVSIYLSVSLFLSLHLSCLSFSISNFNCARDCIRNGSNFNNFPSVSFAHVL